MKQTLQTFGHWTAAAFCAFICFIALFVSPGSGNTEWWKPVFFSFLPMCFFFIGSGTLRMEKEIRELKKQIKDLQGRQTSNHAP